MDPDPDPNLAALFAEQRRADRGHLPDLAALMARSPRPRPRRRWRAAAIAGAAAAGLMAAILPMALPWPDAHDPGEQAAIERTCDDLIAALMTADDGTPGWAGLPGDALLLRR